MSQTGRRAVSKPSFRLSSKTVIDKVVNLLAQAGQERISIYVEDLSSESPDLQVQILNLRLLPSESPTYGRYGYNTPSAVPSSANTTNPQPEQVRFQIEGEEAERFIYPVGSYGKTFIALTWIIMLKDRAFQEAHGITLNTRACVVYNDKRDKDKSQEIWLPGDPSILELLDHVNGFPAVNKYLIAPDGKPLLSDNEEFLRVSERIAHDKYVKNQEPKFEYSNANYIFLGIILELLTQKKLSLLVKEKIIDKLGLTDTTFTIEDLQPEAHERQFVDGWRVSSDGTQSKVDKFNHLNNLVQYASLGLRSSQRDLAAFNREILLALDGGGRLGLDETDLKDFVRGKPMSPYGYFSELGTGVYSESPNYYLFPDQYTPYQLGMPKIQGKGMDLAFRKAGYIDGFSCNATLMPSRRISLMVLGDATGPIDTTFHISNLVLQEALKLSPQVDIIERAIKEGELCCTKLRLIENPEELTHISPRHAGDLAGTYEHERYEQRMTVHGDGTVQFHTRTQTSSKMHLIHIGPDLVMVRPGQQGFSFETWSAWKELRFKVQQTRDGRALAQPGEEYAYKEIA